MELEAILKHLLPEEIFDYFDFKGIKEEGEKQLLIYLDEKPIKPEELSNKEIISIGFDEPIRVQDFPIRGKAAYFVVRRHKWKDKESGKVYSRNWKLTASGTSYSKEFAAFLKGISG